VIHHRLRVRALRSPLLLAELPPVAASLFLGSVVVVDGGLVGCILGAVVIALALVLMVRVPMVRVDLRESELVEHRHLSTGRIDRDSVVEVIVTTENASNCVPVIRVSSGDLYWVGVLPGVQRCRGGLNRRVAAQAAQIAEWASVPLVQKTQLQVVRERDSGQVGDG
jgi:hypothetical protein